MKLFDARLMQLLSFLARQRGWLTAEGVSRKFRLGEEALTARTIHRWFTFLREEGGFVYYPYPKANVLGLQDVLVRVHGLRNPAILGVLPFGASFNVDVGLADGHSFVSQTYWVPGLALRAFEEYWEAARDLGLVDRVDIFRSRNTHFVFSPFHKVIAEDGVARIEDPVDNGYFKALLRHHVREKFEVRVGDRIAESPLVIPIVVEHLWGHYSSKHVWEAIQEKGGGQIRKYGKGSHARALARPGAAMKILQKQFQNLLDHFDEVFVQPRVFFDWPSLANCTVLSFIMRTKSPDGMIEAALAASERAIVTAVKPGVGPEGRFHVSCFLPQDQLQSVLSVVDKYHEGREPPVIALQDRKATLALFDPTYCRVDWRLFDPESLSWRFDTDAYVERLKELKPEPITRRTG